MSDVLKSIVLSLKSSPHSLVVVLIVTGFLSYLYRHDSMDLEKAKLIDKVAEQRIKHCHDVQEDATRVIGRLDETLRNHDKAFTHLLYKLDTFIEEMEKSRLKMDVLLAKITLLEESIEESGEPSREHSEMLQTIVVEIKKLNERLDKNK